MGVPVYTERGWVNGGPPAINGTNLAAMDAQIKALTDWSRTGLSDADVTSLSPSKVGLPKITTSAFSSGPPASPNDGDIWIATGVSAGRKRWTFQYDAADPSAYKWHFIGGPAVGVYDASGNYRQPSANNAWAAMPGLGTLNGARAGYYAFRFGADLSVTATTGYLGVGPAVSNIYSLYHETYSPDAFIGPVCGSVSMLDSGAAAAPAGTTFRLQIDGQIAASVGCYFPWFEITPEKVA